MPEAGPATLAAKIGERPSALSQPQIRATAYLGGGSPVVFCSWTNRRTFWSQIEYSRCQFQPFSKTVRLVTSPMRSAFGVNLLACATPDTAGSSRPSPHPGAPVWRSTSTGRLRSPSGSKLGRNPANSTQLTASSGRPPISPSAYQDAPARPDG